MGYNTYINMGVYNAKFGLEQAFQHDLPLKRIKEIADAIDAFHFPTEGFFGCDEAPFAFGNGWELGDCRWYSQEEDMRKLSLAFPDVLFVLDGDGDDTMDIWTEYWHNGASERNCAEIPPFDPRKMTGGPKTTLEEISENDPKETSADRKTTKYQVTVSRGGSVWVEATSLEEAMDIANHQRTDDVHWSEDWDVTDVFEDDSAPEGMYVTEKAFD